MGMDMIKDKCVNKEFNKIIPGLGVPCTKNANDACSALEGVILRQIRVKMLDDDEIMNEDLERLYEKCEIVGKFLKNVGIVVGDNDILSSFQYGKERKWNYKKFKNYLMGGLEFEEIEKVLVNVFIKQDEYILKSPDQPRRIIGESENGIKRKMCPIFGALSNKLILLDNMKNIKIKLY